MPGVVAVLIAVFALMCSMPGAFAQGILGTGAPFFGNFIGTSGEYALPGAINVDVGYCSHTHPVSFTLEVDGTPVPSAFELINQDYPLEGLWLGISGETAVRESLDLVLSGTWLVFSQGAAKGTYQHFDGSQATRTREMTASTDWYTAEAAGRLWLTGSSALLFGFRYDSFATSLKRPANPINFGGSRPDQEGNIRINSYLPFAGLAVTFGETVKASIIGFPCAPGHARYEETVGSSPVRYEAGGYFSTSYFVEAAAEYGFNVLGGTASLFGTWTWLHGVASVNFTRFDAGVDAGSQTYSLTLDRKNLIIGGRVSIPFQSLL